MNQKYLPYVFVVLILCLASSVAAYMYSNSEPEPEPIVEYKYDFIVNVPNEHETYSLHISDIKADGVRLTPEHVEFHISPDYTMCNSKSGGYECDEGATGMYDLQPESDDSRDVTWTAWTKSALPKDAKVFTVTSKNKIKIFEIENWRPKYVPGFIIKENNIEVLKETENRGSQSEPTPVTYTYTVN